jgi:hypothetical protein
MADIRFPVFFGEEPKSFVRNINIGRKRSVIAFSYTPVR